MNASIRDKLRQHKLETTTEELQHGQIVIVSARWAMVSTGLVLLMWQPGDLPGFTISILVLLTLAVMNFFLHVQILRNQPIGHEAVYAMSLADLVVISLIVVTGAGFESGGFAFYYPAVLAYSLVFPGQVTLLLTTGIIAAYSAIAAPEMAGSELNQQILATRLLMMVAVSYLGYRYRLVERRRLDELRVPAKGACANV